MNFDVMECRHALMRRVVARVAECYVECGFWRVGDRTGLKRIHKLTKIPLSN